MLSVYESIFFSNLSSACFPPLHLPTSSPLHIPFFVFIYFWKPQNLAGYCSGSRQARICCREARGGGTSVVGTPSKSRRSSKEKQPAVQPRFDEHLRETFQCFQRNQLSCIEFALFCKVLSLFCSLQRLGPRFQCLGSTLLLRAGGRKEKKKQEKQTRQAKWAHSKPADGQTQMHPKRTILTSFLPQLISLLSQKKR